MGPRKPKFSHLQVYYHGSCSVYHFLQSAVLFEITVQLPTTSVAYPSSIVRIGRLVNSIDFLEGFDIPEENQYFDTHLKAFT